MRTRPHPLRRYVPCLLFGMVAIALAACSARETSDREQVLEERIEALEARVRALEQPAVVRSQRFELIDAGGTVRGVWSIGDAGYAGLSMRNAAGEEAVWLGEQWGGYRVLRFTDDTGSVRLQLRTSPFLGSYLYLAEQAAPDGSPLNEIQLGTYGQSSLALRTRGACAALVASEHGPASHLGLRAVTREGQVEQMLGTAHDEWTPDITRRVC